MRIRQILSAAVILTGLSETVVQATYATQPWAYVQFSTFEGSSSLIANPLLTQSALHTVSQAPGYVRGYRGRQIENSNIFYLAFEWASISAQKAFEKSSAGRAVATVLTTATASGNGPEWIHLPFAGDYTIAFNAPVTEIALGSLRDDATEGQLVTAIDNAYTGALDAAPGIHIPATRAEIEEQPRTYFLTGGWDSVSDHIAAVSTEPAISLIAEITGTAKPGSTVTHVVFTKIHKRFWIASERRSS